MGTSAGWPTHAAGARFARAVYGFPCSAEASHRRGCASVPNLAREDRTRAFRRALRRTRSSDVRRVSPLRVLSAPADYQGDKGGGPLLDSLDAVRDLAEVTGQDLQGIEVCRELHTRLWEEEPGDAEIASQRELFDPALREARLVLERVEQNILWR